MKLNLGCGGDYKKDYLNVDAFDSTVADKIMSSTDLKLADNTVDEILASQLIEHLGIAGSIYTMSECFRVLKPKKKMIIETPDLQKSFKKYNSGGREARKNLLPWIYGVDIPGMRHRFCYPDDLLKETLQKIGFTNIKTEFIEFDKYQPILKAICEKPSNYQAYQVITAVRKKLLKKKIVNLDNQLTALEQEDLIEFFTRETNKFYKTNDDNSIRNIVAEGSIRSPMMTSILLEEVINKIRLSKKLLKNYLDVLKFLNEINFSNVLLKILKETPGFVGKQDELFKTVCGMGIKTIEKLLQHGEKNDVVSNLRRMSRGITSHEEIDFFSQKLIMLKANRLFQIGAKQFILGKNNDAISSFVEAADFYRNQVLTYWNLGRIFSLQGDRNGAISHYKDALRLLDVFDYDNKRYIKRSLEKEMSNYNLKKYSKPITSLNEI